jgi:hypothetical protein
MSFFCCCSFKLELIFRDLPSVISIDLLLWTMVVGICCSINSSNGYPCASLSRTTFSIWHVGLPIMVGLLMKLLITSSSNWFLSLRDSSSVRGDHRSFSGYLGGGNCRCMIVRLGLAGGYRMRFFLTPPLSIVMLPMRHPMYASVVASHGLPNINGFPSSPLLGLMMRKSIGYSQESTEISMSCNVPIILTTDQSTNCNIIGVGSKESKPKVLQVSMVKILMVAPKYTNVFGKNP